LAIASLFVIGRILYAFGYIFGSITGILSFRSLGFGIGLLVNLILIAYHLGLNSFDILNQYVEPFLKRFI